MTGSYRPTRRTVLGGTVAGVAAGSVASWGGTAVAAPAVRSEPRVEAAESAWREVLEDADMVWQKLPKAWTEGPFLGNALLGSGIYAEPNANAIRFNIQHSEVQDHRPEFGSLFGLARLPIGWFTLEPTGTITGVDWRLSLWNAELTGTVTTDRGTLSLRALVHNQRSVLVVEITASAGEQDFRWVFHPATAISPRAASKPLPDGYAANPPATVDEHDGTSSAVQPLLAGGEHVTAWHEMARGSRRTLYVTVAHSFPAKTAQGKAVRTVRAAAALQYDLLAIDHRAWWQRYYRKSFLSVPDARLQRFYWIQLYKIASAARAEAPVMATCGPWLEPTPWPATWWNLNVQLEYWIVHGSNHLELDAPTRALSEFRDNLSNRLAAPYRKDSAGIPRTTDMQLDNGASVANGGYAVGIPGQDPPTPEVGNLTWALHNVWLTYRHTMDRRILADVVFPLLRKAINYYLHFLQAGPDGKLHLPPTFSPEYGVDAPDTNYDLQLLRWGCSTLLDSVRILDIQDPLEPRWQEVLAKLTPFPVDENGFMIGAGVPFAKSHRHYSHMLAVYPLYEVTWEQPENRQLIETSLKHWISFQGALQGYSYTGAASISAQMLRGDDAVFYLDELLRLFIQPNTMYQESGPVIETPLSAAQSLHDMVCQSWGGVIRVFPALPAAWRDIAVHDFRTQGAFLLSAARQDGTTRWVRLRSEAGAPCTVRTDVPGPLAVVDPHGRPLHWDDLGGGTLRIELPRGREAVIHTAGDRPDFTVRPVAPNAPAPRWGLPA
jgi:alpha-L-fucosidase 2